MGHRPCVCPDGPRKFPQDFWSPAAREGGLREIRLPEQPLRYGGHMFGGEELVNDAGHTLTLRNKFEVRYVLYTQQASHRVVKLPKAPVELSRTVNDYERYLRELRDQLYQSYFTRTLDHAAAERFVREAIKKMGLPEEQLII